MEFTNLKKGNIICSIDDYKINSYGNIIIGESKTIPFKSYIWLFKNSINNTINLKNSNVAIINMNCLYDYSNNKYINVRLVVSPAILNKG